VKKRGGRVTGAARRRVVGGAKAYRGTKVQAQGMKSREKNSNEKQVKKDGRKEEEDHLDGLTRKMREIKEQRACK